LKSFYEEHSEPEQLYLRGLRKEVVKLLKQAQLPKALAVHEKLAGVPCPLRAPMLDSLLKNFRTLQDRRRPRGRRATDRTQLLRQPSERHRNDRPANGRSHP
jgi:hypothetical protein